MAQCRIPPTRMVCIADVDTRLRCSTYCAVCVCYVRDRRVGERRRAPRQTPDRRQDRRGGRRASDRAGFAVSFAIAADEELAQAAATWGLLLRPGSAHTDMHAGR